ncbi:hypothetical protein [Sulfobacillus sp. hq2]|uniref:hypothetical protein n=1 Tax=Sulfobacillus TaxID=28033 RepID=UPI000CD2E6BE|nr:hypothetical protein [Sulfobacillus sp. hq2]POB12327.1 hypothetical protein CO251_00220 [Sulfobacillus sp. hq2]
MAYPHWPHWARRRRGVDRQPRRDPSVLDRSRVVASHTDTHRRRWEPRGGSSPGAALDLIAGIAVFGLILSGLTSLVQVGRGWEAAQRAAYDAAQGVATYGCWTSAVTQVVASDVQTVKTSGTPTVSLTSTASQNGRSIYVGSQFDPLLTVRVGLPITVDWIGVRLLHATLVGQATVTAEDFYREASLGEVSCETPQI